MVGPFHDLSIMISLIISFILSLSDYHFTMVTSCTLWLYYFIVFIVTIFVPYCNGVTIISSTLRYYCYCILCCCIILVFISMFQTDTSVDCHYEVVTCLLLFSLSGLKYNWWCHYMSVVLTIITRCAKVFT